MHPKTAVYSRFNSGVLIRLRHSLFSQRSLALNILFTLLVSIFSPFLALIPVHAAPIPNVTLSLPTEGMVGENFDFTFHFGNNGSTPGYGPYVDLVFPYKGVDGVYPFGIGQEADGINFISADFLGSGVVTKTFDFTTENAGCVAHPYAVDTLGVPVQVCGTIGNKLVVLQMPFGSFVPGQPNIDVTVHASMSSYADVNTLLDIQARAGFMFGSTAVNDFVTDPSIIGTFSHNNINPTIIQLRKDYLGPENETSTGPNFPRQYRVIADIANSQTLTGFRLRDNVPHQEGYLSFGTATPSGSSITHALTDNSINNPPNNNLDVTWGSLTGGSSNNDANYTFNFYGPLRDANNNLVVPVNGGCTNVANDIAAQGTWQPNDPRDTLALVTSDATPNDKTIKLCSHTIQKSFTRINDVAPTGNTPGDTMEYTLNFQISDYFAYDNLTIKDILSDGQRFDTSYEPVLTLHTHGANTTDNVAGGNYTIVDHFTGGTPEVAPINGTQELNFDLSQELISRSFGSDGKVLGGCVPNGGGTLNCSGSSATTGTLTYRAVIQQQFTDQYAPQNAYVDQGDTMSNNVTMTGRVLNNNDLTPTASYITEGSSAGFKIIDGILSNKTIYAMNGIVGSYPSPKIGPGDSITYKVTFDFPLSDVENLVITDYLPLPVFSATSVTSFTPTVDAAVPAVGASKFGPDDTFHAFTGINPAFSTSSGSNTIIWDFGSYHTDNGAAKRLDLLFTVQASNQPFADGLLLTNQAQSKENTTNAGFTTATQITQVVLTLPNIKLTKGAVASDNPAAIFAPTTVGPVSFSTPPATGSCPRYSGTINSTNIATTPIKSDISKVDAGDLVTFAVVVENQGQGVNGAFDMQVKDTIPAGYSVPAGGLNLCVTDGSGTTRAFTAINGGDTNPFVENGIDITDPTPTTGAFSKFDAGNGNNIAVITYNLQVAGSVAATSTFNNTATVTNYAASEGGPNFVPNDLSDQVQTSTPGLTINKSMTGTNIPATTDPNVAVGEIVNYRAVVTVPEGVTPNVSLTDTLDSGLAIKTIDNISTSAGLATSHSGGFAGVVTDAGIPAGGASMTMNFNDLTNNDRDNATPETITIDYSAVVINISANNRGKHLKNTAVVSWPGASASASANDVIVIEPALQLSKSVSSPTADAADPLTYTIVVTNGGLSNSTAYDATISDTIPTGLTYTGSSLTNTAGVAPTGLNIVGNVITATWASLTVGQSSTITFGVTMDSSVVVAQTITNAANAQWTSLAGSVLVPQSTHSTVSTERTGNSGDPGGGANTYTLNTSVNVQVFKPSPSKAIKTTSEAGTAAIGGIERVSIGEIVRYRVQIRMAEASAPNLQILDSLATGLRFLNDGTAKVAFVSEANNLTSSTLVPAVINCDGVGANPNLVFTGNETTIASITPVCPLPDSAVSTSSTINSDTYNDGTDPYFKFGDVVNNERDSNQEFVVIEFNALVDNISGNTTGTQRDNTVQVWVNGTNVESSTAGNPSRVRIAEPTIQMIKSTTLAPVDSGDPYTFRIQLTNTATGNDGMPAYDIVVSDSISAKLSITNVIVTSPNPYVNNSIGPNLSINISSLNKGEVAYIDIYGYVVGAVGPGETITNNATLVFTSLPGANGTTSNPTGSANSGVAGTVYGERTGQDGVGGLNKYAASAGTQFNVGSASLDKLMPNPAVYSVGENVTYDILVNLPEGVTNNLNILDDLPYGMRYLNHEIITSGSPLAHNFAGSTGTSTVTGTSGNGAVVTLNFPSVNITNDNDASNNIFDVRIYAIVLNIPENQNHTTLTNTAAMNYLDPNTLTQTANINAPTPRTVTIKEPILTISKTATSIPSPVQSGSTVSYTMVVQHHVNSTATAEHVVITDPLASGLTNYRNVHITVNGSIPTPDFTTTGGLRIPSAYNFTLPNDGTYLTITFDATVNAGADTQITNNAQVVWVSNSSVLANTRTNSDGPYDLTDLNAHGLNDYRNIASDGSVSTGQPTIEKILNSTSSAYTYDTPSPSQLTIGEDAVIHLKVNMPEGNTGTVVVSDQLVSNLNLVSYRLITTATDSNGDLLHDFNGTVSAPTCPNCVIGSSGPNLVFTFNNVDVTADGDGTNNYFIVEVVAKVRDIPANHGIISSAQTTFSNQASVQANGHTTNASGTLNFKVVEPHFTIAKALETPDHHTTVSPNGTLNTTIAINNDGLTAGQDVNWSDTLPAGMHYSSGSGQIVCSPVIIPAPSFTDGGSDHLSSNISVFPAGTTCTVTFSSTVAADLDFNTIPTLTNATDLAYTSHPTSYPGERDYSVATNSNVIGISVPDLTITKDDSRTSIIPNMNTTYTFVVTNNGTTSANNIIVTDNIPLHTTLVTAETAPGWVCSPDNNAGSSCTYSLPGDFPINTSLVGLPFTVHVDYPLDPSIPSIVNTASITDDHTNGIDPTPGNNVSTDTDTLSPAVDLVLHKFAPAATATFNQDFAYRLEYANIGTGPASNVTLTDNVPQHTTFIPAQSTAGWACTPNNSAGSQCALNIGTAAAGATDNITFAVKTADYPPLFDKIDNTASIADDGIHGPEMTLTNNTDSTSTPVVYTNVFDPPSAYKTVTPKGETKMTWKMVWINDGNITALLTRIIDPIPANTTYVAGSFACDARGASVTTQCYYDSVNNRVFWEGDIAPDAGGTTEDNSLNEVVLTFDTTVINDVTTVSNQALGFFDNNSNGSIDDDILAGETAVITNDPTTTPGADPTVWHRPLTRTGINIAITSGVGLLLLILALVLRFSQGVDLNWIGKKPRQSKHKVNFRVTNAVPKSLSSRIRFRK